MLAAQTCALPASAGAAARKSALRGTPVTPRAVAARPARCAGAVRVRASSQEQQPSLLARVGSGLAALSLAATMQFADVAPAAATELDVLTAPIPVGYIIDDAGMLSRSAITAVNKLGGQIERETGNRIVVITLRKLQVESDPFAFADKVLEKWYPSRAEGDKKGVLLLVKGSRDGALSVGPALNKALGTVVDSVAGDNIPYYAEQEKYSEALTSSLQRIDDVLEGKGDPGPPSVARAKTGSNFRTKEQTESKKGIFQTVVGGLLVISFIVPMVQYYGYIAKERD